MMNANEIVTNFGLTSTSGEVEKLFSWLGTLHRPSLPDDDEFVYHDWVLVRRKGVELGFTDSEYQLAAPRFRWRHGDLLLTQAYFYSGFDDVQPFTGELPYGLSFSDGMDSVRAKLAAFHTSRHSHITDTWDVEGYRLNVQYRTDRNSIERIACRQLAAPIKRVHPVATWPSLEEIVAAFGTRISESAFTELWGAYLDTEKKQEAVQDNEIDFTETFGATLSFVGDGGASPIFRSITMHRNRDRESVGWEGKLPLTLEFEDSPEALFAKVGAVAVQQSDSVLTGHGVWHFRACTMHVLYSNVDNRLLRVKLMAPGTWKCIEDN